MPLMSQYKDNFEKDCLTILFPRFDPNIPINSTYGPDRGNPKILTYKFSTDSLFDLEPEFKPNSNTFLHFTSLKGLFGIINNLKLRAYNLTNVNDPNEFQLMKQVFDYKLDGLKGNIFCASFIDSSIQTNDVENFVHWRLYGESGGGALIEFEISPHVSSFNGWIFAKVIYDGQGAHNKLNDFMKAVKIFESINDIKIAQNSLYNITKYFCALHKTDFFSYEKESRLFYIGEDPSSINGNMNQVFVDVSRYNEVVYYKELKIDQKNSPTLLKIKKIQLGFKHDDEFVRKVQESINMYYLNTLISFNVEKSPLGNLLR